MENPRDLWAETEQEGNQKFLEQTRKLWQEIAVHGVLGEDKENGGQVLMNSTDLDGKCALFLLEKARINTSKVKYLPQGAFENGYINIDTGNRDGVVADIDDKTAFLDHHGPHSKRDNSATKEVYQTLVSLGLLKRDRYLDDMVEFVTQVDNKTFPDQEKYFDDSWRTILGLQRFLTAPKLFSFLKQGKKPIDILTTEEIEKIKLTKRAGEVKRGIERSKEVLGALEQNGLIIESPRYGRIVVDVEKQVPAGFDAALAYGCDGYLIWSPTQNNFFLTTKKPIEEDFGQGQKIRETMWIKPRHDPAPLKIGLEDILAKLMGEKTFELSPEQRKITEDLIAKKKKTNKEGS